MTPDQYGLLGRLLKQLCIDQRCPIADFRAAQDLPVGELPKPLVLRRVEEAKPRMRGDEDRWHFHQVLLNLLGDAAQSRSVFFTVRDRGFDRGEFVRGCGSGAQGPWLRT